MLDFGCISGIVPISRLPGKARWYIIQSNIQVSGIGGSVSILGELIYNLNLDDYNSPIFKDMKILVLTSIYIGQNILNTGCASPYDLAHGALTVVSNEVRLLLLTIRH